MGYALDETGTFVVYFTLNGNWVGEGPSNIIGSCQLRYFGIWHAAFSSSGPCKVSINIGQEPFLFDVNLFLLFEFNFYDIYYSNIWLKD